MSILRGVLLAGAMLVVFIAASRATNVLWWFAQAIVFAALAYPAIAWMGRWVPRFVAILVLTAALLALAGATVGFGLVELRDESVRFADLVPRAMQRLEQTDGIGHLARQLHLADAMDNFAESLTKRFHFEGTDVTGLAMKTAENLSVGFIVWVLTVMLVFTGPSMARGLLSLLPDRHREGAATVLARAYNRSTSYVGLTSARAVAVFLVVLGVATALGLDMPALLAVVAAVAAYLPYVGILVGALPVSLMALLNSPLEAGLVLAAAAVLQALDVAFLQRAIVARSMDLGLFASLAAAMVGFSLRGAGGAIVALAVIAMVMATVQDTGTMRSLTGNSPDGADGSGARDSGDGDSGEGVDAERDGRDAQHAQHDQLEGATGETVP